MEIYVGNLSYSTEESSLREMFEAYGQVAKVNIIKDKMTGQSKGFGFVSMEDWKAAKKAIDELNGKELNGRTMVVNQARERTDRPQRKERRHNRRY